MSLYPVHLPKGDAILSITHPSSYEWLIELHNGEDNRFTEHFIESAVLPALEHVEREWLKSPAFENSKYARGSLTIVGKRSQEKFFSNGFQLDEILKKPEIISNSYNALISKLLSYPMPTIAVLNGHTFAAGFIVALACDYRVIRSDKDRNIWGCMNEVHFGASLPASFNALLNKKIGDQTVLRKVALEGHRFTPSELSKAGLVDTVVDGSTEVLLQVASSIAERWSVNATNGAWGVIKQGLYSDVIKVCSERNVKLNLIKPRL